MMMRIQEIPETNCSSWFFNDQQFACFFVREIWENKIHHAFSHQMIVFTKFNNTKNSPSNKLNRNSLQLQCCNAGKAHELVSKNSLQTEFTKDLGRNIYLSSFIICCQCYNMNMCLMNLNKRMQRRSIKEK
jgi:hypothetical protein